MDDKSVDDISVDKKSADVKSADRISVDKRSADDRSVDKMSADKRSMDDKSVDDISVDKKSADVKSADRISVDKRSADDRSVDKVYETKGFVKNEVTANFQSHRQSISGVCELRKIRKKIYFDSYVFDSLISKINSPSASLLYIYLYRRTIAEGNQTIQISGTVLSEVLGFSSKAVRSAIKFLIELGFLELLPSEKSSITATYRVLTPFD
jgi:hypothetical protein